MEREHVRQLIHHQTTRKRHPNARDKCNMMQLEAWIPSWLTADLSQSLLIRSAGQPGLVQLFSCLGMVHARFEVKELTKSKYKVIGVIYQNWEAWDGDEWCQGIPEESGRTLLLLSCIAPQIPAIPRFSTVCQAAVKCIPASCS